MNFDREGSAMGGSDIGSGVVRAVALLDPVTGWRYALARYELPASQSARTNAGTEIRERTDCTSTWGASDEPIEPFQFS